LTHAFAVEKIVIDQTSMAKFMNDLCPGAYSSLSKVDFDALDFLKIKVKGVYGCKEMIAQFLLSAKAIDESLYAHPNISLSKRWSHHRFRYRDIVIPHDIGDYTLRSGLYLVRTGNTSDGSQQVVAVYWPENKTWDDDAPSPVRRNRIAFVRYA